ncbi:unnamed protein product, partial [Symbiodinium pilosum]
CVGRLMSRTPRDYEKLKEDEWDFDGVGRESLNDFLDEDKAFEFVPVGASPRKNERSKRLAGGYI